jgi:hypothetical protein
MKPTIIFILLILVCGLSKSDDKCIKGEIEYSVATYSDEFFLKPKYQRLFDSLFQKRAYLYFCNTPINNLPTHKKGTKSNISPVESHIIEPLFIELSSFNGVYGKRIYHLDSKIRNPKYRCGFFHHLFIISDDKYFELTNDTLNNEKVIERTLKGFFTKEEIVLLKNYYKHGVICSEFTFLPPFYIKKGEKIIFDSRKE